MPDIPAETGKVGVETARGNVPVNTQLNRLTEYTRHSNPITGASLIDRGLKELERMVPQVILEVLNYNFYGYRRVNGTISPVLAYGHERAQEVVEDEWWPITLEKALKTNAIITKEIGDKRNTLDTSNFLEVYVSMYVRTAVNLRNLLGVMNMAEYNAGFASFLLDANLPGGGRLKKALNLLDQLAKIPIPEFFRRRAIALAGVFRSGVGEPVIASLFCNAPSVSYTLSGGAQTCKMRGLSGTNTLLTLRDAGSFYVGALAKNVWAETILADAKFCIQALNATATSVSTAGSVADGKVPALWNSDVVKVQDIWELLDIQGSKLPPALDAPLDSKFDYLQKVNDRPFMWYEETAGVADDHFLVTNHVISDQDTNVRLFGGEPPREWFAGFGSWALTAIESSDLDTGKAKIAGDDDIIIYGEVDPLVSGVTAVATEGTVTGNATRQMPAYFWYNRQGGWHQGLRAIDDNLLKSAGIGDEKPSLDPLLNRNVNMFKASRIKDESASVIPIGMYPVNRPYMMDLFEQNLDDLSNGWLQVMSEAVGMPEN